MVRNFDRRQRQPGPAERQGRKRRLDGRSEDATRGRQRPGKLQLERLFGKHAIEAVLLKRPRAIRRLLIAGRESYYADIIRLCQQRSVVAETVPWPQFMQLGEFAENDKHQGILALVTPIQVFGDADLPRLGDASCVIALDQVSNPQNLAAILRSASFFHADAVILMRHRSADITSEVQRHAVGGAEFVDIYKITNLADTLDELKHLNFRVFGLDERGERTLAETELPPKIVLVVGAEGEGLRLKTREHCDELVRIPGGRQAVESLNAAVAATIALYEFYRLR